MRAAFVTHADCLKHEMGASHPERPARLAAIEDELIASGIGQHLERYDAPLATDEQLARVHPIEYVKAIREVAPREGTIHLDPDTAPNMVNIPLAAGAGSRQFRDAVEEAWIPALNRFRPELILFSAGFDAHAEDEMAMLSFSDADYAWVTEQVKEVAERDAGGRMVSVLEGGYALGALGRSVVQHLRVMAGLNA